MGKKVLVAVTLLVSLVVVVSTQRPYVEAGSTARADYETCRRACEESFARCMSNCDGYPPADVQKCQADCRYEKQRCNCQ